MTVTLHLTASSSPALPLDYRYLTYILHLTSYILLLTSYILCHEFEYALISSQPAQLPPSLFTSKTHTFHIQNSYLSHPKLIPRHLIFSNLLKNIPTCLWITMTSDGHGEYSLSTSTCV